MAIVCWSHVGQGVHKAICCSDVTRAVGTENRCIKGVLGRFYLAQGKILVCFPLHQTLSSLPFGFIAVP